MRPLFQKSLQVDMIQVNGCKWTNFWNTDHDKVNANKKYHHHYYNTSISNIIRNTVFLHLLVLFMHRDIHISKFRIRRFKIHSKLPANVFSPLKSYGLVSQLLSYLLSQIFHLWFVLRDMFCKTIHSRINTIIPSIMKQ